MITGPGIAEWQVVVRSLFTRVRRGHLNLSQIEVACFFMSPRTLVGKGIVRHDVKSDGRDVIQVEHSVNEINIARNMIA